MTFETGTKSTVRTYIAAGARSLVVLALMGCHHHRLPRQTPPGAPVLNEVIGTGQSLSTGYGSTPAIDTTPLSSDTLMFTPGVRPMLNATDPTLYLDPRSLTGLVPLREAGTIDYNGETIGAGFTWGVQRLQREAGRPPYPMLFSVHGVGGQPYFRLRRGTPPYENSRLAVKQAMALAYPRRIVVRAVTVTHGESDQSWGSTRSGYEADLVQWQADYERDLKDLTGQHEPVPMLIDQMCSYTSAAFGTDATWSHPLERLRRWMRGKPPYGATTSSGIPLAQLDAAVHHPDRIILVAPKYFLDYRIDGAHLTATAEELLGEYYAKVYKTAVIDARPWSPLRPLKASLIGSKIIIQFQVPVPPLALDTTNVSDPGNFGFLYRDDSLSAHIRKVRLSGPDEVTIDLDRMPNGTHPTISYAWVGKLGNGGGPLTGPRGNLRDSDSMPSRLTGKPLYNWCVIFELPLS